MYKWLLSWRYLKSRYIALASIISVMLGVATLIVVNSVMAGFSAEMHDRLHGILSDVVLRSHNLDGFPDPNWHMEEIRKQVGDDTELEYRAAWGDRGMRVTLTIGPDGGLTNFVFLTPDPR